MFNLKDYLKAIRRIVDDELRHYLISPSGETRLGEAMTYSVMAGGKRLRPVLCIATAEAVGGGHRQTVLPFACAIELLHTYSLIHDDLPAMDDDETRRGKPTCHVRFDEATAILAGDALLTLCFEIVNSAACKAEGSEIKRWTKASAGLASAAGWQGMIEGQMRDMIFENTSLSVEDLESLHLLKTGKLIEAAVGGGALLAGAKGEEQQALEAYARHIGLAFQVADDVLNVKGDPKRLGKATGTDQERGKNTYPTLVGLEEAEALANRLTNKALKAIDAFDNKADSLRAIAHYVIERTR